MKNIKSKNGNIGGGVAVMALFTMWATLIAAWITHVMHCLLAGKYLLLIAGAIIAPVGAIHGIGLWFGVQW